MVMAVSDCLKTKLNMCAHSLPFFCLSYICFIYVLDITYVCTFLSYKYTTYRLLD